MSKLTFDELVRTLVDEDKESVSEEDIMELVIEVLNVGADVLNRLPKNKIAGMVSLVQTATGVAAQENGEILVSSLVHTQLFSDAIIYAFQAAAGILTMEEVR